MKNNFVPPGPLITPVLFLIFNRPDTTQQVFNAIKQAKPKQLFVAADGPRKDKEGEKEKCEQARKIIEQVDWDCEVKTLFRDKNLGCKISVSSAIDWFFENVEEGIILEDDCLPSQSFFWFCQELLDRYRNDERVMQVCGSNVLHRWKKSDDSYYFSKYAIIWGWASWRRAWKYYDVNMLLWPEIKKKKLHYGYYFNKDEAVVREHLFDRVYYGEIDTWDYQWSFAKYINSGLSITPSLNLVSNIGMGENATHAAGNNDPKANLEIFEIEFPLRHPKIVIKNFVDDYIYFKRFIKLTKFTKFKKIIKKIIGRKILRIIK